MTNVQQLYNKALIIKNLLKQIRNGMSNRLIQFKSVDEKMNNDEVYYDMLNAYDQYVEKLRIVPNEQIFSYSKQNCLKLIIVNKHIIGVYKQGEKILISYDKIEDVKKSQRLEIPVELKYNNKSIPFNEINDMYCINTSSIFEETNDSLINLFIVGNVESIFKLVYFQIIDENDEWQIQNVNVVADYLYNSHIRDIEVIDDMVNVIGISYTGTIINEMMLDSKTHFTLSSSNGIVFTINNFHINSCVNVWNNQTCKIHDPKKLKNDIELSLKVSDDSIGLLYSSCRFDLILKQHVNDTSNLSGVVTVDANYSNKTIICNYDGKNILYMSICPSQPLCMTLKLKKHTRTITKEQTLVEQLQFEIKFDNIDSMPKSFTLDIDENKLLFHNSVDLKGEWYGSAIMYDGLRYFETLDIDEFFNSFQNDYTIISSGYDTNNSLLIASMTDMKWNIVNYTGCDEIAKWSSMAQSVEQYVSTPNKEWFGYDGVPDDVENEKCVSIVHVWSSYKNSYIRFFIWESGNMKYLTIKDKDVEFVNLSNQIEIINIKRYMEPNLIELQLRHYTINGDELYLRLRFSKIYDRTSDDKVKITKIERKLLCSGMNENNEIVSVFSTDYGETWNATNNKGMKGPIVDICNYSLKSNKLSNNLAIGHYGFVMNANDLYAYNKKSNTWQGLMNDYTINDGENVSIINTINISKTEDEMSVDVKMPANGFMTLKPKTIQRSEEDSKIIYTLTTEIKFEEEWCSSMNGDYEIKYIVEGLLDDEDYNFDGILASNGVIFNVSRKSSNQFTIRKNNDDINCFGFDFISKTTMINGESEKLISSTHSAEPTSDEEQITTNVEFLPKTEFVYISDETDPSTETRTIIFGEYNQKQTKTIVNKNGQDVIISWIGVQKTTTEEIKKRLKITPDFSILDEMNLIYRNMTDKYNEPTETVIYKYNMQRLFTYDIKINHDEMDVIDLMLNQTETAKLNENVYKISGPNNYEQEIIINNINETYGIELGNYRQFPRIIVKNSNGIQVLNINNKIFFKSNNDVLFNIDVVIKEKAKMLVTKNYLSSTPESTQLIINQLSPSFTLENKLLTINDNYLICYDDENAIIFDLTSNAFLFDEVITK